MATLTEAAHYSRIIIKWGFVSVVGLMIGRMVVGSIYAWYRAAHPIIPPPTLGFGMLPSLEFPQKDQASLTYHLETIDGKLPSFATQAEVLYMPATRPNLLAMERSVEVASALGYKDKPEKITDVSYRWKNISPITSTLTMQIYDGRFVLDTDWVSNPNFLSVHQLPESDEATKEALDLIHKTGVTAEDLSSDSVVLHYLKGMVSGYQSVPSLSDADFVEVDFFRSPYKGKYNFVTSDPNKGIVQVTLSGNSNLAQYSHVEYNYFPIDYTKIETYPLKPIETAWKELQSGKGFIAQIDKGINDVTVRKVEFGYYDSYLSQHYAQPVYIFSGDGNFIAYVAALADLSQPTTK